MSVRQYIGARYVPLFADPITWDPTQTYEALTVVLYQGNSYTSRQAVPANIDITNQTYWAQTGNYNAQVEQYRQEVQTFDSRITANMQAISAEVTARQNAVSGEETARQNADSALSDSLTNLATLLPSTQFTSVNTIKKYIDESIADAEKGLPKRSFVCFGDSYGSGIYRKQDDSGYESSANGWLRYMEEVVGQSGFCDVVTNRSTIVAGNSGFASASKFLDVLNDLLQRQIIDDPESVTDVVCIAGTNDIPYTEGVIEQAVGAFCTRAKEVFPNAEIRIGCFANNIAGTNHVARAYRIGGASLGAHYISSTRFLAHKREYISPDNVHPNVAGYNFYLPLLLDCVFNGDCDYRIITDINIGENSPITFSNLRMRSIVTPDSFGIQIIPAYGDTTIILGTVTNWTDARITYDVPIANMPFMPSYSELIMKLGRYSNVEVAASTVTWNMYPCANGYVMGSSPTTLKITKPPTAPYGTDPCFYVENSFMEIYGESL